MVQPQRIYVDGNCATGGTLVECGAGLIGGQLGGGVIGYQDIAVSGATSVTVQYSVVFPYGMEFVKQGKLPGLIAGFQTVFDPSNLPNGYNGATVRPVWQANGQICLYVWDMKCTSYGRIVASPAGVFVPGKKHTLKLTVTLNTPGSDDGVATLYVDGVLQVRCSDLKARLSDAMRISQAFWCCFYGGGDASYAPTRTQQIFIGDLVAV